MLPPRECPPWVDPAWWEVYGGQLEAGPPCAWVAGVARAWGLVRNPASLQDWEISDQAYYMARLLGWKILDLDGRYVWVKE